MIRSHKSWHFCILKKSTKGFTKIYGWEGTAQRPFHAVTPLQPLDVINLNKGFSSEAELLWETPIKQGLRSYGHQAEAARRKGGLLLSGSRRPCCHSQNGKLRTEAFLQSQTGSFRLSGQFSQMIVLTMRPENISQLHKDGTPSAHSRLKKLFYKHHTPFLRHRSRQLRRQPLSFHSSSRPVSCAHSNPSLLPPPPPIPPNLFLSGTE